MKKIISFIMAVMLTATTYGFVGTNENFGASTVYAAEAFNSDDFEIKNNVIVKCSNQEIRSVVIPDNIVGIEPEAFKGCTELETVEMTNSVRWIGENAFQYCFSLKDVTVSSFITNGEKVFSDCENEWSIENGYSSDGFNVTFSDSEITKYEEEDEADFHSDMYVRDSAFRDCKYVKSVNIPEKYICIEPEAFKGCTELETVEMTNSVRWIGENAFQYCFSLKDVTVSSFITNGEEVFSDCIIDWSIENGYSSDGFNVRFSDSEITKYEKEDEADFHSDMYVRSSAFQDCEYVKSVFIPENYVYVEDGAFVHCSNLRKATLPSTLKKYDNNAFAYSPTVISVTGATIGDTNNDGSLTSADLMRLRKYLLGNDMTIMNSDMNQDDRINIIDMIKLIGLFLDE